MATYSTDLTTLTTAESGTWTEFASPYNGGGTPALSGENFIQGNNCYSQTTGKATGLAISCVFDNGSNVTFAAGEVVLMWIFYFAGTNLDTYANSGWRIGIGSSTSAWDWFRVGGSDYADHKKGGWRNFAIDPTATESGTIGGGNGGSYRYFGGVPNTLNEVTKGDPAAVDAIRYGRGELSVTGTGGSFTELASYNDYNAGGTPPGTSSTSIDTGRHVLGLFEAVAGGFQWKGLLAFGLTGTSVTFTDSNQTITIEDCPHTYPSFNKIEVRNASSSVTLTNITITSTATTANGVGYFEMVANATVTLSGCSFNDMGTFIFQSNADVDGCNFNGCQLITAGGATITGCSINRSTSTASMIAGAADMANITGNRFVSDGSNHAVEINSLGSGSFTWNNIATGYVSGGSGGSPVTPTSTGNETIYVNVASGTLTINVADGATTPSIRSAGATVNVVAGQKTFSFTLNPSITGYEWRIYSVTAAGSLAGASELAGQESATQDNQSYSYSYTSNITIAVQIISQPDEDYEESITYYTLGNADQDVTINLEIDINNPEVLTPPPASLIVPSADRASLQLYITGEEQTGSDGSSITTVTDQSGNVTGITVTDVTLNITAGGLKEFDFATANARINIGQPSNLEFSPSSSEVTILVVLGETLGNSGTTLVHRGDRTAGDGEIAFYYSAAGGVYVRSFTGGSTVGDSTKGSNIAAGDGIAFVISDGGTTTRNRVYFNGVIATAEGDVTHSETTERNDDWFIGVEEIGAGFQSDYEGTIRAVMIFSEVLTTAIMENIIDEINAQ